MPGFSKCIFTAVVIFVNKTRKTWLPTGEAHDPPNSVSPTLGYHSLREKKIKLGFYRNTCLSTEQGKYIHLAPDDPALAS